MERKYDKPENRLLLPGWAFAVGVLLFLGSFFIAEHFHTSLPKPLSDELENEGKFIAENAWVTTKELTSIGVRFTGSRKNEILAVKLLRKKIEEVIASKPKHEVELDHQVVSGSFPISVFGSVMSGAYINVQNLVVKLHGEDSKNAVMLNCHFDSAIGSPGASDNAANCGVMLEILRILATSDRKLKHSVIFLFNGAEEVLLQAAHGFITQHKWAPEVKAFINLESAGSGGKEVLFQAGPRHPWLIEKYSKVPHPAAQTAGEEIFQSELIPSDTDFRIFRDYGRIPGLDFAHNRNGHRYHTKYDNLWFIGPAYLQHTGDNIFELVRQIADSDELPRSSELEGDHTIFYDLFGLVFVHYSTQTAQILHSVLAIAVIYLPVMYWKRTHSLNSRMFGLSAIGVVFTVVSLVLSVAAVWVISYIINIFDKSMSWYSDPWLAILLYGFTAIWMTLFVYVYGNAVIPKKYRELSRFALVQGLTEGVNIFWAGLLLTAVGFGLRSHYILFVVLVFVVLGQLVQAALKLQGRKWMYAATIAQIPVLVYVASNTLLILPVFIPIMGRSGSGNAELKIGILTALTTFLAISYLAPLAVAVRGSRILTGVLYVLTVIGVVLICTTRVGFPYRGGDPKRDSFVQRHFVTHTRRTFFDLERKVRFQDSGFWFRVMDKHCKKTIDGVASPHAAISHWHPRVCRNESMCGLPLAQSRELQRGGYWVAGPNPVIIPVNDLGEPKTVQVDERTREISASLTENVFTTMFIQPLLGAATLEIVQNGTESIGKFEFPRGQTSYIQITHGLKDRGKLSFVLRVEGEPGENGKWVDLTVVTHLMEAQRDFTQDFRELLNRFPKWSFVVPMVANVYAYQF